MPENDPSTYGLCQSKTETECDSYNKNITFDDCVANYALGEVEKKFGCSMNGRKKHSCLLNSSSDVVKAEILDFFYGNALCQKILLLNKLVRLLIGIEVSTVEINQDSD
jgi:hypothetical protein